MEERSSLPKRMAWFAPWRWSLWQRILLGGVIMMGAVTGLFLLVLWWLMPFDIYIHDIYIPLPKIF